MAEVIINTNLSERKWLVNDYFKPYIRRSALDRFMGEGADAVIRIFNESKTDGGKDIVVPLVGTIKNAGVSGSQVLEGNEVDLEQFADVVTTNWRRNAVKAPKSATYKSNLDILRIAGPALRDWAARYILKKGLIDNLQGVVVPLGLNAEGFALPDIVKTYENATAAERNTWLVNNRDRMLFGALESNGSSGVMATALATLDNTDDKMSAAVINLAVSKAKATADLDAAGPAINPYMLDNGEEWYVIALHRDQMRDLRQDPVIFQSQKDAGVRGKDNPLFRNGDVIYNGWIATEVADMRKVTGAGAGGIDVAQAVLMGQSAVAVAWGQMPRLIGDNSQDYGFRPAKAIEELIGIKKTSFVGKQYGTVSVWTAAVPNA